MSGPAKREEAGSNGESDDPIDLSDIRWDDYLVLAVFWVLACVVFLQQRK